MTMEEKEKKNTFPSFYLSWPHLFFIQFVVKLTELYYENPFIETELIYTEVTKGSFGNCECSSMQKIGITYVMTT